jgi:hypothetical protein
VFKVILNKLIIYTNLRVKCLLVLPVRGIVLFFFKMLPSMRMIKMIKKKELSSYIESSSSLN